MNEKKIFGSCVIYDIIFVKVKRCYLQHLFLCYQKEKKHFFTNFQKIIWLFICNKSGLLGINKMCYSFCGKNFQNFENFEKKEKKESIL